MIWRRKARAAEAFTIVPSLTLPSPTSMLTGVGVQKHQVTWNDYAPTNGLIRVPTIFSLAKQHGFKTAMFVGKEKFKHLELPGTIDTLVWPQPDDDAKSVAKAFAAEFGKTKPNLTFIHFRDPDTIGHKYGAYAPEKVQALKDCDEALKTTKDAVATAGVLSQSVFILTADHGAHDSKDRRGKTVGSHGDARPEDVLIPWVVWGKGVKPGFTITAPVLQYDTAATALWLLRVPLPEHFWGRPVVSAFKQAPSPTFFERAGFFHWAVRAASPILPAAQSGIIAMKVTLNWLKQYVDFTWSVEETVERLTMLGLEVEGVQKITGAFDGIVVAQILTRDPVPGSDKLSVCRVNDGKGERTIICGAQNHQPGDKVPLILPNSALPLKPGDKEPFVIKERKVFGITSQGMMCSPQELGLPDEVDGLLILPTDAPIGKPFAEYLGRSGGDVVFDLEVTPNRPDLNSVIGIAREIAAVTGNPLRIPTFNIQHSTLNVEDCVSVRIEDAELCPRYTARVIKGVKVGPSPDWLRSTLEKVGIRSISNVVDVTNFVMLEVGQPLHAFDYHLVGQASRRSQTSTGNDGDRRDACPTIVIRRAAAGEKFKTLDNQERTLTNEMLLIADEQKGIALAGVMGGANTEINDQTVDVLIESAYFAPTNIRRTSKQLGLRSESSYRFERGADVNICDWASRRAAQLILETAGGQLAEGVVDAHPQPAGPKLVTLRHHKVDELLGITLQPQEMEFYLGQLGLKAVNRKARPVDDNGPMEPTTFQIPTWRVDLKREADLIEEVERLHGLNKVPATPPRGAIGTNAFDPVHDQIGEARRILTGLGLNEAQGQTLISKEECRMPEAELVALANPLSSDMDVLRPSLLPGLIHSLRHNVTRKNYDVALFEIGRVFKAGPASCRPATMKPAQNPGLPTARAEALLGQAGSLSYVEEHRVAIALTGQRHQSFWSGGDRDATFDLSDLKGFVEELLEQFGVRGVTFTRRAESTAIFLESATVALGGKLPLGELGQLSPVLAKKYDLRDAVLLAELNLDQLLARRNPAKSFKPLPQFPSSRRDVAMLVPESTTHDAVLQAVKQAKPANLERVELFDVFRGKHVPEGQKSLAYAFTYRAADKTLTDDEVNAAHDRVVGQFKQKLAAVIR